MVNNVEYDEVKISPDDSSPEMLTYHIVPRGNPTSENLTLYVTSENEMLICIAEPATLNEPEEIFERSILFALAIV